MFLIKCDLCGNKMKCTCAIGFNYKIGMHIIFYLNIKKSICLGLSLYIGEYVNINKNPRKSTVIFINNNLFH